MQLSGNGARYGGMRVADRRHVVVRVEVHGACVIEEIRTRTSDNFDGMLVAQSHIAADKKSPYMQ